MATKRDRRQKRAKSRRQRAGAPAKRRAPAQPPLDGLVGAILAGGSEIIAEDDPLRAEAWASAMIGSFYKAPLPFEAAEELRRSIGPAIIERAEAQADDEALAVLRALAAVGDDDLRDLTAAAADRLAAAGVAEPSWGAAIGHPDFIDCWRMSDVFGDQDGYHFRFAYPGACAHLVLALHDHNLGGIIKDAFAGELRGDVDPRARAEAEPGVDVVEVTPDHAAAVVRAAVAIGDQFIDNDWTGDFFDTRALLLSRMRLLPQIVLPELEPLADEAQEALRDEFLALPDVPHRSLAGGIVDHCLVARCWFGDGDPLRWSPIVVELLLLDFLPRKVLLDPAEVDAVPDVLLAWIRFALAKRGVDERFVAEVEEAVHRHTPEFRTLIADPEAFGPGKTMGAAMAADGVDMADEESIQAWVDAYNARLDDRD